MQEALPETHPRTRRHEPFAGRISDGRSHRWAEHRVQRRAELVAAGLTAVRRRGASTTLDDMATAAGVTKPVLYRHFQDRQDLFGAVLEAIADDVLMPRILDALAGLADDPDVEPTDPQVIRGVVAAFVEVVDAEPDLYRFALAHTAAGPDEDFVAATERRIAAVLAAVMTERLHELRRSDDGAEVWAYGVVGMVQLATQRWFEHRAMPAEQLVDLLTTLVTGGLAEALKPR